MILYMRSYVYTNIIHDRENTANTTTAFIANKTKFEPIGGMLASLLNIQMFMRMAFDRTTN